MTKEGSLSHNFGYATFQSTAEFVLSYEINTERSIQGAV